MNRINRCKIILQCLIIFLMSLLMSACSPSNYDSNLYSDCQQNNAEIYDNSEQHDGLEGNEEYSKESGQSDHSGKTSIDDGIDQEEVCTLLPQEMTWFDEENPHNYIEQPICRIDETKEKIECSISFRDRVPRSDDDRIYLFELASYEQEGISEDADPVASAVKAKEINFTVDYTRKRLFSRFVPAILYEGEYIPLSVSQFITNPEILSKDLGETPDYPSKKGLLLDANSVGKDELTNLNVKRVIYNMPLSFIIGETGSPACPTIEYEYNGDIYQFNAYMLAGFDSLFKYLTDNGYHTTVIILNDWNEDYPEIIHPLSRKKTWRSLYYAFNTEEEEGTKLIEATASFLADRYTGGDFGTVYDWVIANEINQQAVWNYMNTADIDYYTESFERGFRIFYNAIKSNYADANVYFSIDQDWNRNGGNNRKYFNGRDLLYKFNETAKMRGNYDWGLSIHPYPMPLNNTFFWRGQFDKTEKAKVVTPMNLSAVTSVMTKHTFRDTKGEVRSIGVTELGFCSRVGEEAQAAAFAYCYYIIEDNEYIDSFLLNRQYDDEGALKSGLSLGIYNKDYSEKKLAEVFRNIDTRRRDEYIQKMLLIIGEDSLEDALEKAR